MILPETAGESGNATIGPADRVPNMPEILSNQHGSFAWNVLHKRHPALIHQIREAYPYGPGQLRRLDTFMDEIAEGTIRPLPEAAHGKAAWDAWGTDYYGRAWPDVPFLWAESYFYAKLLNALAFWESGPWYGVDPFMFLKSAELWSPELNDDLLQLERLAALPDDQAMRVLLHASLWGNRADLGFRIGAAAIGAGSPTSDHLVADDSTALLAAVGAGPAGRLCLIADNAGREVLSDLMLVDRLILAGAVDTVDLHLKPYPYYVSDATTADLTACLRRLASGPTAAVESARRLHHAFHAGRISLYTHWFYCAPYPFHRMPSDLRQRLESSTLTVLKGDLNYRRLVEDCLWPATTPFPKVAAYFPTPVAVLRTLKSDVVVGLDSTCVMSLDGSGEPWRTNGAHGLVQALL